MIGPKDEPKIDNECGEWSDEEVTVPDTTTNSDDQRDE
jgi:hypothetical protein